MEVGVHLYLLIGNGNDCDALVALTIRGANESKLSDSIHEE